jgi:signal peptidase II
LTLDVSGESVAGHGSRGTRRWAAFLLLAAAVAAVDQAAKEAVRSTFAPGEGVDGIGSYSIFHVQNDGVAGGGLEGNALPLAVLSIMAVVGLYEFLSQRRDTILLLVGFGLLVGGGVGNLVDRARLGSVTDYIRNGGHAFNIADVAILVGGVLVAVALIGSLGSLRPRRSQPTSKGT